MATERLGLLTVDALSRLPKLHRLFKTEAGRAPDVLNSLTGGGALGGAAAARGRELNRDPLYN